MSSPGTVEHYTAWQPKIDHGEYNVDLRPLEGNWTGEQPYGFTCMISRNDGQTEQLPKFLGSSWSADPDDAQYHAFKQAAYFLTFNTLPVTSPIHLVRGVDEDYGTKVDGLHVVPEFSE